MNWTKVVTSGLPVQKEGEDDTIPCLVIRHKQIMIMVWNAYHVCWDDEDGDDSVCGPEGVEYWMRLSDLPKPE